MDVVELMVVVPFSFDIVDKEATVRRHSVQSMSLLFPLLEIGFHTLSAGSDFSKESAAGKHDGNPEHPTNLKSTPSTLAPGNSSAKS